MSMLPRVGLDTTRIPAKVYYENISEILNPEYSNLDAESVRLLLEQSNIDAEYMESILGMLKDIGKKVVKAMPQILPVAAPIIGGVVGGPAGATVGSMVGGFAGSPSQPAQPSAPPATLPPITGLQNLPSQQQMPGGSQAASILAQLLYNPKLLESLMAMIMGQAGAPNISVGSKQVRPSAFTNLLGELAKQATAEYNAMESLIRPYRENEDYAGEQVDDPIESAIRANMLLKGLNEEDLEETNHYAKRFPFRTASEVDIESETYDEMSETYDEMSEAYDEMILIELYSDLNNWG